LIRRRGRRKSYPRRPRPTCRSQRGRRQRLIGGNRRQRPIRARGCRQLRRRLGHSLRQRSRHANRGLFQARRSWPHFGRRLLIGNLLHFRSARRRLPQQVPLKLQRRVQSRRSGQQIPRRLSDHKLAARRGEDRHQADLDLLAADFIPWDPDAIARPQVRGAIVRGEVLGREGILAIRRLVFGALLRVVVAVHDELPLDRHRPVLTVIEINPAAETAGRLLARRVQHRRRPHHRHPRRPRILAFGDLRLLFHPALRPPWRLKRLAAGQA
jgi:hypothetical protein